jgi:hypothetical protein
MAFAPIGVEEYVRLHLKSNVDEDPTAYLESLPGLTTTQFPHRTSSFLPSIRCHSRVSGNPHSLTLPCAWPPSPLRIGPTKGRRHKNQCRRHHASSLLRAALFDNRRTLFCARQPDELEARQF